MIDIFFLVFSESNCWRHRDRSMWSYLWPRVMRANCFPQIFTESAESCGGVFFCLLSRINRNFLSSRYYYCLFLKKRFLHCCLNTVIWAGSWGVHWPVLRIVKKMIPCPAEERVIFSLHVLNPSGMFEKMERLVDFREEQGRQKKDVPFPEERFFPAHFQQKG